MQNNKFSSPHRMSHSAIPVIYFNLIKSQYEELIAFTIILFLSNDDLTPLQKILYPVAALVLYFLYIGVRAFLKYYFCKFHVEDKSLIVSRGLFRKETLNIPTYKVHSLRTRSGFFYRLFDMKGVSFDTLASKGKEVELILDDADWAALLELVKNDNPADAAMVHEEVTDSDVKVDEGIALNYSNMDLIKGALCQNHLKGTLVIATVLFTFIGQIDFDILEKFAIYASDNMGHVSYTITSVIITLVVIYIISLLLWLGKVMLRYYNMKLNISNEKLFFESGLVTRRSVRFAYDKVCTLLVKTNPLEKLFKCSTVSLKQAFNITDEKEKGDVLIYGCTLHENLLQWWLGKDYRYSSQIMILHSGRGLLWYSLRTHLIIAIIASALLVYYGYAELLILAALYLAYAVFNSLMTVRHSKLELKDDYIKINSGGITLNEHYVKYTNVEHIRLKKSPFTPLFHRVHLIISTNGTLLVIRSLKETEAEEAYDMILAKLYEKK